MNVLNQMRQWRQLEFWRMSASTSAGTSDLPSLLRPPEEPHEPFLQRVKWNRVLVMLVIGYLLICFMYGAFSILDLKDQKNDLYMQTMAALDEQKALQEQIDTLHTDAAMEQIAREQLGMVSPGEVLVKEQENTLVEESKAPTRAEVGT